MPCRRRAIDDASSAHHYTNNRLSHCHADVDGGSRRSDGWRNGFAHEATRKRRGRHALKPKCRNRRRPSYKQPSGGIITRNTPAAQMSGWLSDYDVPHACRRMLPHGAISFHDDDCRPAYQARISCQESMTSTSHRRYADRSACPRLGDISRPTMAHACAAPRAAASYWSTNDIISKPVTSCMGRPILCPPTRPRSNGRNQRPRHAPPMIRARNRRGVRKCR